MELLEYRDAFRRQNRAVAHWIAIHAWVRGVDCVVIERSHIRQLYGTVVLKDKKLAWFQEDIRPWFPFQRAYYWGGSLPACIYASRLPTKDFLTDDRMADDTRLARMMEIGGPKGMVLNAILKLESLPPFDQVVKDLALYSAGVSAPKRKRLAS